jgi:hypothetical protein
MLCKKAMLTGLMALAAALASTSAFAQTPQGSAFTYQGVLKSGGTPANGTFHLRFQLWDALSGGAQIGADVDQPALVVTDGLFTADLNFGTLAFTGSARWLQVQVITNGGATITPLTPRQPISAAPYALYALGADGPNLTNLNASNLASGTVPSGQLSGTYANTLALNNLSNTIAGTFTGNGAGLTNLNATNIASGNLPPTRLPTGGGWLLTSTLNIDSNTLAIDPVHNRVGIGTAAPSHLLHVRGIGPVMVLQDSASASNQAGYVGFWNNTSVETGWMGYGTPGSPHLTVRNARVNGNIVLSPGAGGGDVIISGGSVGISTSAPEFLLHVNGTAGKPGGGSWATASDARLKKNIVDLEGALDSLLALRGVEFEYINPKAINEPAGRRIGMIAQEVERVFPDWVSEGTDGYKRLAFSGFEALTVEAFRDLRAEKDADIVALRAEIEELKMRVQSLARRSQTGGRP